MKQQENIYTMKGLLVIVLGLVVSVEGGQFEGDFQLPKLVQAGANGTEEVPAKSCSIIKESIYDNNVICINGVELSEGSIRDATKLTVICDKNREPDETLKDLRPFENIIELRIENCKLKELPMLPKSLAKIELYNLNDIRRIGYPKMASEVLQELEIINCTKISNIYDLPEIRKLVIKGSPLLHGCESIKRLPKTLRIISLTGIGQKREKPLCLDKKLVKDRFLNKLDLSNNYILNINEFLSSGNIRELDLSGTLDNRDRPITFLSCNEVLRSLRELNLDNNGYTRLLEFYNRSESTQICFQSLERLSIQRNSILMLSFHELESHQLRSLIRLNLANNPLKCLPMDKPRWPNMKRDPLTIDIRDNQINANCMLKDFIENIDSMKYVRLESNCNTMAIELHGSNDINERYTRMPCNLGEDLHKILLTKSLMCQKPLRPAIRLVDRSRRRLSEVKRKHFSVQNDSPVKEADILSNPNDADFMGSLKFFDLTNEKEDLSDSVLCETTGDPKPVISWLLVDLQNRRASLPVNSLVTTPTFADNKLTLTWELLKKSAYFNENEAYFVCNARNKMGESNSYLKVLLPKIITKSISNTQMMRDKGEGGGVGQLGSSVSIILLSIIFVYFI